VQEFTEQNWSGHHRFTRTRVHRPTTVTEVQRIVAGAERAKVIGSRHCFNDIADTAGDLLWLGDLEGDVSIDPQRRTATVPGGWTYGRLCPALDAAGWALPNLASLHHITVVGAAMSATHGSGDGRQNLAGAVSGLELVVAGGEVVRLSRDADGDRFAEAVVALGALAVVTSVTVDLVPAFHLRQDVYDRLPWEVLFDRFEEVMGPAIR
jgi:xylitol oxidase